MNGDASQSGQRVMELPDAVSFTQANRVPAAFCFYFARRCITLR